MNASCTHRTIISTYQKALAEAWGIDEGDIAHREEFMEIAEEIGETFAAKFPDGLPGRASKASKGN
ncbi:MAG TPA: hypothetical protein VHY56_14225 [Candidatus Binataceae bacterium]|nr:hypothetical protein [Candidatus Binataceae bacterium]